MEHVQDILVVADYHAENNHEKGTWYLLCQNAISGTKTQKTKKGTRYLFSYPSVLGSGVRTAPNVLRGRPAPWKTAEDAIPDSLRAFSELSSMSREASVLFPVQPATLPPVIRLDRHNISYYSRPMTEK